MSHQKNFYIFENVLSILVKTKLKKKLKIFFYILIKNNIHKIYCQTSYLY